MSRDAPQLMLMGCIGNIASFQGIGSPALLIVGCAIALSLP